MDRVTRAKEIVSKIVYVTIATSSKEAEPRSTPVHAAFDDLYNIFWTSFSDTQHSKNIRENPRVYISIYDEGISQGDGIYVKAKAVELSDPLEIENAVALVYGRKEKTPRNAEEFMGESMRRMYKATPEQFWVSLDEDVKKDPATSKKEISLS